MCCRNAANSMRRLQAVAAHHRTGHIDERASLPHRWRYICRRCVCRRYMCRRTRCCRGSCHRRLCCCSLPLCLCLGSRVNQRLCLRLCLIRLGPRLDLLRGRRRGLRCLCLRLDLSSQLALRSTFQSRTLIFCRCKRLGDCFALNHAVRCVRNVSDNISCCYLYGDTDFRAKEWISGGSIVAPGTPA